MILEIFIFAKNRKWTETTLQGPITPQVPDAPLLQETKTANKTSKLLEKARTWRALTIPAELPQLLTKLRNQPMLDSTNSFKETSRVWDQEVREPVSEHQPLGKALLRNLLDRVPVKLFWINPLRKAKKFETRSRIALWVRCEKWENLLRFKWRTKWWATTRFETPLRELLCLSSSPKGPKLAT